MAWKNVVNLNKLKLKAVKKAAHYHYEYAALGTRMGAKKLGFNVSTLPPKQYSCPYHFHHSEEELFLILTGSAILRQANRYREVKAGDLIFFTNSPKGAHQFYNHTAKTCRYLALSTMDELEVAEYPDSKKVYVSRLKKVFQRGMEVDYLKDEENPARLWPKRLRKISAL